MWTCGFLPRWKKGEAVSFGFLFVWIYRCRCIIESYSRAVFVTVELCEICTVSCELNLSGVFLGAVGRDYWWAILLLPPGSQLGFPSVTWSVALTFFTGVLLQPCSWKAEFVIREYSRATDFLFLNKKVRSCWVLCPFDWESRFSEMAAE